MIFLLHREGSRAGGCGPRGLPCRCPHLGQSRGPSVRPLPRGPVSPSGGPAAVLDGCRSSLSPPPSPAPSRPASAGTAGLETGNRLSSTRVRWKSLGKLEGLGQIPRFSSPCPEVACSAPFAGCGGTGQSRTRTPEAFPGSSEY